MTQSCVEHSEESSVRHRTEARREAGVRKNKEQTGEGTKQSEERVCEDRSLYKLHCFIQPCSYEEMLDVFLG